jgi:hypothetical protein
VRARRIEPLARICAHKGLPSQRTTKQIVLQEAHLKATTESHLETTPDNPRMSALRGKADLHEQHSGFRF